MRIGINSTYLCNDHKTGIENYSTALILHLLKNDSINKYSLFSANKFPKDMQNMLFGSNIFISPFIKGWHSLRLPVELRKHPVDIFLDPGYTIPPFTKAKTVVTVHDLAHKYFPDAYTRKQIKSLEKVFYTLEKNADGLIFTSQNTKNDFLKYYPNYHGKKLVAYQSINKDYFSSGASNSSNNYIKYAPYILTIGRLEKRKNTAQLVRSYNILRQQHPEFKHKLLLVGSPGHGIDEIKKEINNNGFANDIIEIGYASKDDIPSLYSNAEVFVFPSLYEGFGIPILEAFAAKTPVICSNNSSLPEVAGEAALYCRSNSVNDISDKIFQIISDKKLSKDLIARGIKQLDKFEWDKTSISIIDFLNEVYESRNNS